MIVRLIVAAIVLVLAGANPSYAYLKFGVRIGNRDLTLKWADTPVRYFVYNRAVPGVTSADFASAVGRAFATWQSVPTASISYQLAGFTAARPGDDDGRNTLGFEDAPELDRVLASTSFLIDIVNGELIESDIFFNTAFSWSVSGAGQSGRYDLESIAVHEIGHLTGLGHSAIGETSLLDGGRRVLSAETVMFPLAYRSGNILGRTLRADDVAGVSELYPEERFNSNTGTVSGRVTKNGQGVRGVHVVAFNPATGSLIGNFSLNGQGQFFIAGLAPGAHIIRAEPLDDADVESFFDSDFAVDLNVRGAFYDRLVVAPRGGDSGEIEVKVIAR